MLDPNTIRLPQRWSQTLFFIIILFTNSQNTFGQTDIFNSDWNKVTITKIAYPEFNLAQYKNLIIAEILNERGRKDNKTQIVYNKIASKLHEIPDVKLLDREQTDLILKEYKLQSTGYVEEDYVTPFGKFFSSGIIMTGRIVNSNYKKQTKTSSSIVSNGKKKKYRKGTYNISFSIQFIDISTTQIVYSKTIDAKYTIKTKSDYTTPPSINENEVYLGAINLLSEKFKNLFTPHEVEYKIKFQKNSKFNTELKNVAALVQVEEFDLAYEKLKVILQNKKVIKSDKALSSAYYNIAMLEIYTNKYDDAKKNAKLGYLKNPKNSECLKLIKILQ